VHGTKIGVAISPDGLLWSYAGTAKLPSQCTDVTSWAPEVFYDRGIYHMVNRGSGHLPSLGRSRRAGAYHAPDEQGPEDPDLREAIESQGRAHHRRHGRAVGQHPDVVVNGGRALIYYFVHQRNEPEARDEPYWAQRTAIQVAELTIKDGWLAGDREGPVRDGLQAPAV
jgi:hypothetical protein